MAIAHKARRPRADYPPMRIVHFSGAALSYGLTEKKLEVGLSESLIPQKPSRTVSSSGTKLVWMWHWKRSEIAIASERLQSTRYSWRRESAEQRESCNLISSRSHEESRRQFAGIHAAAAIELGNRTQGRLWAHPEPLWIGALSVSPECFSRSRFVCPERSLLFQVWTGRFICFTTCGLLRHPVLCRLASDQDARKDGHLCRARAITILIQIEYEDAGLGGRCPAQSRGQGSSVCLLCKGDCDPLRVHGARKHRCVRSAVWESELCVCCSCVFVLRNRSDRSPGFRQAEQISVLVENVSHRRECKLVLADSYPVTVPRRSLFKIPFWIRGVGHLGHCRDRAQKRAFDTWLFRIGCEGVEGRDRKAIFWHRN